MKESGQKRLFYMYWEYCLEGGDRNSRLPVLYRKIHGTLYQYGKPLADARCVLWGWYVPAGDSLPNTEWQWRELS